jgi:hypothetical protein
VGLFQVERFFYKEKEMTTELKLNFGLNLRTYELLADVVDPVRADADVIDLETNSSHVEASEETSHKRPVIIGTDSEDSLKSGRDCGGVILALNGNDSLLSGTRQGSESMYTELNGGSGNDTLTGGNFDVLQAGSGNDYLSQFSEVYIDPAVSYMEGENGDDQIGGGSYDVLSGGNGEDSLGILPAFGYNTDEVSAALGENNSDFISVFLTEESHSWIVDGGAGNDTIGIVRGQAVELETQTEKDATDDEDDTEQTYTITAGPGADTIIYSLSNIGEGVDQLTGSDHSFAKPNPIDLSDFQSGIDKIVLTPESDASLLELFPGMDASFDPLTGSSLTSLDIVDVNLEDFDKDDLETPTLVIGESEIWFMKGDGTDSMTLFTIGEDALIKSSDVHWNAPEE